MRPSAGADDRGVISRYRRCDGIMAQTIAKRTITWGLVNIPVTVHAATAPHSVPLHQVHTRCGGGRIRLRRICEREEVEVLSAAIDGRGGYRVLGAGRPPLTLKTSAVAMPASSSAFTTCATVSPAPSGGMTRTSPTTG